MTENTTRADVVIIGGGPVGVALAILLSDRGTDTILIEEHEDVYPLPRAVHIDSEVYRILNQLGVGEEFAQISRAASGLRLVDRGQRVIAQFDRAIASGADMPEASLFDQPELERLLRDRLVTRSAVRPLFGHTATAVQQDAHSVTVAVSGPSGETTIEAAYAVACDGANSRVRQQVGIEVEELGFQQRWLVIDVVCNAQLEDWGGVYQICDVEQPGTFMRIGGQRYRWEFRLPSSDGPVPHDAESLRDLLRPWLGKHPDAEVEFVRIAEYTFKAEVAKQWRKGRVLLAGDAAHLTPPFIGQGLGSGLRDASNLAWKLASVVSHTSPPELLDSYEQERKPHASGLIRKAIMIGRLMTGGDPLARIARGAVFPVASRIPVAGEKILSSATPPLATGSLVPRGTRRRVRGTLAPHSRVRDSVRPNPTLDEELGTGPIMLVLGADTAAPDVGRVRRIVVDGAGRDSDLARWMRASRIDWAVVRPDRTVLMAGKAGHVLSPVEKRTLALVGLDGSF